MRSDQFGNPIFQERDIFNLFYRGQTEYLSQIFVDPSEDINKLFKQAEISPRSVDSYENLEFFDEANQSNWFIPEEYKNFNLIPWLYDQCTTDAEKQRVDEELEAFVKLGMFELLFALKYIVDTLRNNGIVWGVGRGSSVASYVLYLIGVHKIDSLKYNLDWREFLR